MDSRRFLRRCLVLGVVLGSVGSPLLDTAEAYRLTNRDLRIYGLTGIYRGYAGGTISIWNGVTYDVFAIDERTTERLPVPRRTTVTGPSGDNGFFLTHRPADGNLRRMTIRADYSGVSFNPEFGENMVGNGSKVIRVVRRGLGRPRLAMFVSDSLDERSVFDGSLFTSWRIRGNYAK